MMNLLGVILGERTLQANYTREAELRKLAAQLKEDQKKLEPLRKAYEERRRENIRTESPNGFVMVEDWK